MAKENYISLKGQLRTQPRFIQDENGDDSCVIFPLLVLRRNIRDRAGNLTPQFDRPIIQSSNADMILAAKRLSPYDIVEIKGTFRVQKMKRTAICDKCGEKSIIESSFQTINPTYIGIVSSECKSDTEGTNYLIQIAEISNIAKVIGYVVSPTDTIELKETDRGVPYCKYQIAINRKLYIEGSRGEEDHTDYPIIYSYGDIAEDDVSVLQQGAMVYLDGFLRTSTLERKEICPHCGCEFIVKNKRMTLSPYSMEYLRDYKGDVLESTHAKNKKSDGEEKIISR